MKTDLDRGFRMAPENLDVPFSMMNWSYNMEPSEKWGRVRTELVMGVYLALS